ncbi:hypothetical protein FMM05_18075 [Flavobacterium zepuense]|uniref:Uncharacterized protein n=1 Tax=Flavobacterium zepuense TaxID=2593302 RepID=A0A552UVZ4_9FLAO|nr:hypothetical protein [Flavobacterium zepuense]TRW22411.1 hypothetical protein FMM05_18075 [Flavobacterium zepuense]
MKHLITIIIIIIIIMLSLQCLYGQNAPKKEGEIVVKIIGHYFKTDEDNKITKKISNRANRPSTVFYLDKNGRLLEKLGYAKPHSNDLKRIDNFTTYQYNNLNLLVKEIKFYTDGEKTFYRGYESTYNYNDNNKPIEELKNLHFGDSVSKKINYEYDQNGNKTKTIFESGYYLERLYDSTNRLKIKRQVYKNQLTWEYIYTYTDSTRIGNFTTYHGDGEDYTKDEIVRYNNDNQIIEREEIYTNENGLDTKYKYFYSKEGLFEKTEYYERFLSHQKDYHIVSYTIIKTDGLSTNRDKTVVAMINKILQSDDD